MTATVGSGNASSRSSTAWPRASPASTLAASVMPRKPPMSAPAMKPPGLAERMTRPVGRSCDTIVRTASSSVSTSSESVLALASFLSNKSQATPSSSLRMRQWIHGPGSAGAAANGPSSRSRLPMTSSAGLPVCDVIFASMAGPSHRLDQHGAALPAADAFGGDAALQAEPLHGVNEMQHDAVAARADRMADADRAAVDVEPVARDRAGGAVEAEHLAAELGILPCRETTEHLRREGFVELPQLDVAEGKLMATQQRGRAVDRAEAHDRRIERRPFAVDDDGPGRELVRFHGVFRGENHPGGAVGDLRAVAGRHLAPGPLEGRPELAEVVGAAVGPHAVVVVVERAVAREGGLDLFLEDAFPLRARKPLLAFRCIFVGLPARDVKQVADQLGGLPHVEIGDRIGEAALEPDDGLEHGGTHAEQRHEPRPEGGRAGQAR